MYEPQDALRHEYRALRLLKEAQQATRVYTQRVGFESPPLDFDRRASGDLEKVGNRSRRLPSPPPEDRAPAAKALRLVGELRAGLATPEAAGELADAEPVLRRAAQAGGVELAAIDALRTVTTALERGEQLDDTALSALESGLWRLLGAPPPRPRRSVGTGGLLDDYRRRLGGGPVSLGGLTFGTCPPPSPGPPWRSPWCSPA